ncbi:MAG: isochorismatase family cysteine hydrolase [Thermodesulfobacteriota bacterium]
MQKNEQRVAGGYLRKMPEIYPSETALLIIDMINDCIHPEGAYGRQGISNPKVKDIVPPIVKLTGVCRRLGIPVIGIVTITHRNAYGASVDMGLALAQRPFLRHEGFGQGTWGTKMIDEIPQCDYVIEKVRLNAFFQTSLDTLLRGLGVQTLLLTGIQTNYCVESTARAAWDLDYQFVVVEDCVTCFDPRLHQASLETLANLGGVAGSYDVIEATNRGK